MAEISLLYTNKLSLSGVVFGENQTGRGREVRRKVVIQPGKDNTFREVR